MNHSKKIALVHDFLVSYGGAERVFQVMCERYPEAPIYTLLANTKIAQKHFPGREIRTSWLGRLPQFIQKRYRLFLPFFPAAVESLDLREFDLVISSSGAWSKGIITRLHTTHIAYLHSPMRYVWDCHESYLAELGARGRSIFTRMLLSYLRIWDKQAAERPDVLLANSQYTRERILKYYRREASVVYPPVTLLDSDVMQKEVKREYFLIVSRLTKSKKVAETIEAFNKLALPLVVVGTGPEESYLKRIARSTVSFRGFVDDYELISLYRGARALIFPAEEDFGMTAVEALSQATPVIGLDYGGLREILSPETGEVFHSSAPEIIAEGVRRFLEHEGQYNKEAMKERAQCFSKERFQKEITSILSNSQS